MEKLNEIIRISFNYAKPSIAFETSWVILAVIALILLILLIIYSKWVKKHFRVHELEIGIPGLPRSTFKVKRNSENLYIANRIYIELTTRKAAIQIDEENDVISEVYNSWYDLFKIIREEIKSVPGDFLKSHDPTDALIGLSTKILNEGLRPHLTEYQADFRMWYNHELEKEENNSLAPQQIQKKYPKYSQLIASMKIVNQTLADYANELKKLIKGK